MEKEQVLSGHLIHRSSRLPLMDRDIFLTHAEPCRQQPLPILLHGFEPSCPQHGALRTQLPCPGTVAHSRCVCIYEKKIALGLICSLL